MASRKLVVPMWMVNDTLFHYSARESAEQLSTEQSPATEIWVGVDANYTILEQQSTDLFKGWIFDNEPLATACADAYNLACL